MVVAGADVDLVAAVVVAAAEAVVAVAMIDAAVTVANVTVKAVIVALAETEMTTEVLPRMVDVLQ